MSSERAATSADIEQTLVRLVADVSAAAGTDLGGIVLYGGLAKHRYTPGISDINVLIVVHSTSYAVLERLADVLTMARRRDRVAALVVTLPELHRFAALFPVKVADIQATHRLLAGTIDLADITIDPRLLHLRAAQESANRALRARQILLEHRSDPNALWGALVNELPGLAVTLETVLRARGDDVPEDRADVMRAGADALGLRVTIEPFAGLHRHLARPADHDVRLAFAAWLELLDRIALAVDDLK